MKKLFAAVMASIFVMAAGAWAAVDIPKNVVALFQKRCAVCHRGKTPPKGLSWEPTQIALAIDRPSHELPEMKIIDSSDPGASYLLKKVRRESGIKGRPMPPPKALTAEELQVIETWVAGLKQAADPNDDLRISHRIFRTF